MLLIILIFTNFVIRKDSLLLAHFLFPTGVGAHYTFGIMKFILAKIKSKVEW